MQIKKLPGGNRLIIGKNSVREVIRWKRDSIVELLSVKATPDLEVDTSRLKIRQVDRDNLTQIANSDSHQGLAVIVKDLSDRLTLKDRLKALEEKPEALVLVLAEVQDPHHLGAAFRACEVFGVDLLVFPKSNSASLSPAVTKVAVGATELVEYCQVANINEALRKLKDSNFWTVAADPGTEQSATIETFDFPIRTAIIFGAEGAGLPRLTLELSDFKVYIPQLGKIDSLSLSQALAVFLYQARFLRGKRLS